MEDIWFSRDYPVLDELVRRMDTKLQTGIPSLSEVALATGFPVEDVGNAAIALDDAGLIELKMTITGGDPGPWRVVGISGQARVLVGAWPSPETIANSVLRELELQMGVEVDESKRKWYRNLVGDAGGVAKATAVEILSSAIAKAVTPF